MSSVTLVHISSWLPFRLAEKEKEKLSKFGIVPNTSIEKNDNIVSKISSNEYDEDDQNPKKKIQPTEFTEKEFKRRSSIFEILGLKEPAQ